MLYYKIELILSMFRCPSVAIVMLARDAYQTSSDDTISQNYRNSNEILKRIDR